MTDTIAAISTAPSAGGIGIVRISGEKARDVADKVFKSKSGKTVKQTAGYHALYGRVFDGDEPVDEAIALVFASPKSYTGEDVVELSAHGGTVVLRKNRIDAGNRVGKLRSAKSGPYVCVTVRCPNQAYRAGVNRICVNRAGVRCKVQYVDPIGF